MILIGCVMSSVSPKPLFIEDQTFLEGALIALQRQGVGLALAGMIIGLGYWFFAERTIVVFRNATSHGQSASNSHSVNPNG
jgi:hypothetical protein